MNKNQFWAIYFLILGCTMSIQSMIDKTNYRYFAGTTMTMLLFLAVINIVKYIKNEK